MDRFFIFRENTYNLRNFQIILNENKTKKRYGLEAIIYRTPLLWANLLDEYIYNSHILWVNLNRKWKLGNMMHMSVGYADLSFRI